MNVWHQVLDDELLIWGMTAPENALVFREGTYYHNKARQVREKWR